MPFSSLRSAREIPAAVLLLAVLAGCETIIRPILPTATPGPSPTPVPPTARLEPTPTVEVLILPTPLPPTVPPPTATPEGAWLTGGVHVFPGPEHYAGDILSIEIEIENAHLLSDDAEIRLILNGDDELDTDPFVAQSPLRADVLVYRWTWDTAGQEGTHRLTLEMASQAGEIPGSLEFYVQILPVEQRPMHEIGATWQELEMECCILHYITGTAAHRDLEEIADRAAGSVNSVEEVFGVEIDVVFPITLIDNIWGNGAYASDEIVVSYVDRAYVSLDLDSVLRHEAAHYASFEIGESAPTILAEGIAVYVSGGHYKPEPIPARGAALLELERYIPLTELADDFRAHQHEIAYIEAAGLIAYLVETYGWESFLELYAQEMEASPSEWLDRAFTEVYGIGLEDTESAYLDWLRAQDPAGQVDDLRLTIELFETIRRYQLVYAHYQEALPGYEEAFNRGVTAEFLRESATPENIALEALLIEAREALEEGRYSDAEALIGHVNLVLDTGNFSQPPISDYIAIANMLLEAGYQAQDIDIAGFSATVSAIHLTRWPELESLAATYMDGHWRLAVELDQGG